MDKVQQVIVMRTKYPDGENKTKKLRTGKYCAQSSHASIAFLTNKFKGDLFFINESEQEINFTVTLTKEERIWVKDKFTKICVYVESEEELLDIYKKAQKEGLTSNLIKDAGDTEFNGIATYTAVAIGPHYKSKLDPVTGHLPLL